MASSARIDELRKKFEENPRRYFAPLANEYRKAGQIDQAIAICREYLPQQPGHMSGHIVYGQALYEARQFEEAKGVFETALSLDPENLIALRHLGDIALLIGDSDAAKMWYRRVLEADPRNEEIQAQLLTLEQASPAPTPEPDSDPNSKFAPPVSSSAKTVVVEAVPPPTPGSAAQQAARLSGERRQPWARKTPGSMSVASDPTPAAGTPTVTATSKTLETFPAIPEAAEPTVIDGAAAPALELEPAAGTSFSKTPTVPIETSSIAGLETTSLSAAVPAPEPALAPPPAPPPAETTGPGTDTDLPRFSLLDVPSLDTEASKVPPESGPFVTETMAELYLQQGHREEALRVYRALLDQRPGDAGLQERVSKLESEQSYGSGVPADSAVSEAPPSSASAEGSSHASGAESARSTEPVAPVATGPTMRELLLAIAQRRPGFRIPLSVVDGDAPARAAAPRASGAPTPLAREDALGQLFSNASIASQDEGAALVLALAFTETPNGASPPESPPIEGAPAHRASNELSLETVFGSGQGASGGSVSYDQFFAQRPSGGQAAGIDPRDDVAHFTKWLEGLKRR